MTDFLECPTQAEVDAAIAELRAAEDADLRALYTAWHAGLETPPAWYVQAGRPAPPRPDQGTDYRPGAGWTQPARALPKRTFVLPLVGRPGACVAVVRDRADRSPADRVMRPVKARGDLGALYEEAIVADGRPFPKRPSDRGGIGGRPGKPLDPGRGAG